LSQRSARKNAIAEFGGAHSDSESDRILKWWQVRSIVNLHIGKDSSLRSE